MCVFDLMSLIWWLYFWGPATPERWYRILDFLCVELSWCETGIFNRLTWETTTFTFKNTAWIGELFNVKTCICCRIWLPACPPMSSHLDDQEGGGPVFQWPNQWHHGLWGSSCPGHFHSLSPLSWILRGMLEITTVLSSSNSWSRFPSQGEVLYMAGSGSRHQCCTAYIWQATLIPGARKQLHWHTDWWPSN